MVRTRSSDHGISSKAEDSDLWCGVPLERGSPCVLRPDGVGRRVPCLGSARSPESRTCDNVAVIVPSKDSPIPRELPKRVEMAEVDVKVVEICE